MIALNYASYVGPYEVPEWPMVGEDLFDREPGLRAYEQFGGVFNPDLWTEEDEHSLHQWGKLANDFPLKTGPLTWRKEKVSVNSHNDPEARRRAVSELVKFFKANDVGIGKGLKWLNQHHYPPAIEWVKEAKYQVAAENRRNAKPPVLVAIVKAPFNAPRYKVTPAKPEVKPVIPSLSKIIDVPVYTKIEITPVLPPPPAEPTKKEDIVPLALPATPEITSEESDFVRSRREKLKYCEDLAMENPTKNVDWFVEEVRKKFGEGLRNIDVRGIVNTARELHGVNASKGGRPKPIATSIPVSEPKHMPPAPPKESEDPEVEATLFEDDEDLPKLTFVKKLPDKNGSAGVAEKYDKVVRVLVKHPGEWAPVYTPLPTEAKAKMHATQQSWVNGMEKRGAEAVIRGKVVFARMVMKTT